MAYCPRCGTALAPGTSSCATCGQAVAPASAAAPAVATPAAVPAKKSKAPWIIGGLIGCGCLSIPVIGIVAAIVIPNYVDALEKAKVRRTVNDLSNLQTALMAYSTDQVGSDSFFPQVSSVAELESSLVPTYIAELPKLDAWGHPLAYRCWNDGSDSTTGCNAFAVGSGGRDGSFDYEDLSYYEEETLDPTDFDGDLIFSSDGPLQVPARR